MNQVVKPVVLDIGDEAEYALLYEKLKAIDSNIMDESDLVFFGPEAVADIGRQARALFFGKSPVFQNMFALHVYEKHGANEYLWVLDYLDPQVKILAYGSGANHPNMSA